MCLLALRCPPAPGSVSFFGYRVCLRSPLQNELTVGHNTSCGTWSWVGSHTFEEDNLVVAGTFIHSIHAVQVQRQAPPEAMHLSRLQGHQVPVPGQPPEVLAWVRKGKVAVGACCWQLMGAVLPFHRTPGLPLKKNASPRIWATASKWAVHL